jgi:4-amino-4-deoxy-L-arabinose transferase-like glycosyltransferase
MTPMIGSSSMGKQSSPGSRGTRLATLVAAALFTTVWFALLAQRSLFDPDEGRYAEIPREMAAGGDWVVPHLDGLVYLEKPPLQYWLSALTYRAFGPNEFTARLCTGLAGYASLGLVFFTALRLWGRRAACRAVLLCMASTLFVLLAHQLTLDMLLTACLTACLTCYLMAESQVTASREASRRGRLWLLGCWAAMALAVLAKGLIGLLIPGSTLLIYALWQRDFGVLRRLNLRAGLPLFALIGAPWFIAAARANRAFLDFFFVREHFQRYFTPIEHRTEPWWFFVPVLTVGILPWLPQAARAMALPLRAPAAHYAFEPARVLYAWCAFVLIFFSISHSKLIPYILPAVPALALLCAAPTTARVMRRELILGGVLSLGSCLGVLAYIGGLWTTSAGRQLEVQSAPMLRVTALLLFAAAMGCFELLRRKRPEASLAALCVGWFLAIASLLVAAGTVQGSFSSKDAAVELRRLANPSSPVFSVQTYEQSFTFYLGREIVLVDYRGELSLGLSQRPEGGIASLAQFSSRWRSLTDGYALMPPDTRDRLLGQGLPLRELARFPHEVLVSRR